MSTAAKPDRNGRTAAQALEQHRTAALESLEILRRQLAELPADSVNWGHVGSAAYVARRLHELAHGDEHPYTVGDRCD